MNVPKEARANCPECGLLVAFNADGSIPWHLRSRRVPNMTGYLGMRSEIDEKCPGVGQQIAAAKQESAK